jgi:hypothetical protein
VAGVLVVLSYTLDRELTGALQLAPAPNASAER